jgi:glycerol-3-phosphate cytidylyltransferase
MYSVGVTFGAFDGMHYGHIELLRKAKKKCKTLVVCVSTDDYIYANKGKDPIYLLDERISAIKAIKYVDAVDLQSLEQDKARLIKKHKADAVFVGNDWRQETFTGEGQDAEVVYLPRTAGISTTLITAENKRHQELALTVRDIECMFPQYKFYLQFGSLLGAVREGGMIKSDSDMDICYLSHYSEKKDIIKEAIDIYGVMRKQGIYVKHFEYPYTESTKTPVNPNGQAHVQTRGVAIDLFTSWIDKGNNYYTCQWGNFGNADNFFPLELIEYEKIKLLAPKNSDIILSRLYGNWQEPKKEKASLYIPRKHYLYEV